ncbi:MAG: hypothetical protein JNJ98_04175 [Gemmatimonadetes bacterium]|nr:hypothetical protein [Gemmatimonadota bacterium]
MLPALGLAACGDGYPDDWASMPGTVAALVGGACPELSGTWKVEFAREVVQSRLGRSIGRRRPRFNWETITIEGEADDSLVITTRRSDSLIAAQRAWSREHGDPGEYEAGKLRHAATRWREGSFFQMTDEEYAANLALLSLTPVRRYVLTRGTDYTCDAGRMVSERFLQGWYRDRDGNPRDTVIGEVRVARNRGGDLVFEARYREEVKLGLWAETNAGIPLGTWTKHQWSRLVPTTPAVSTPEPRPWAGPFVAEYPIGHEGDGMVSTWSPDEIAGIVRPLVATGAALGDVSRVGRAFRLSLTAASTDPFARTLAAWRRSQRFSLIQVARLDGEPGRWRMEVRVYATARPSTLSASMLASRVATLLGSRVRVDSVRELHGGASLYLVCTGRGAWIESIDALNRSRELRLASYMFDRLDPGDVSRGWVHVEERMELYTGSPTR